MPSRTARLSKKGCGFATPECRAQRDVAVHPRPAPPPPLLAAPRLSTTALGDLEIRWVVSYWNAGWLQLLRGWVSLTVSATSGPLALSVSTYGTWPASCGLFLATPL